MSVIDVKLPDSLYKKLFEFSKEEGFSIEQFMVSAASEKLSFMLQSEFLQREARLGTREGFEKVMNAVPDVEPENPDDRIDF